MVQYWKSLYKHHARNRTCSVAGNLGRDSARLDIWTDATVQISSRAESLPRLEVQRDVPPPPLE